MDNKYIELHLQRFSEYKNEFLVELYIYLLKSKNCKYIMLNFLKDVFENIDKSIFDKVFKSYVYKNIDKYSDLPLSYDGEEEELEILELTNVELNEVMLEAVIETFSKESIKIIQELGWEKMMIFNKCHFDDSIVVGSYDYQDYIIISNIDSNDLRRIKRILTKYIDECDMKKVTDSI